MKLLRLRLLIGITAVTTALSWAAAKLWASLDTVPAVPAAAPLVLAAVAVILLATAISLRSRLKAARERRPDAKRVDPLSAARAVVLGQASALVSAVVTGIYAGAGIYLLGELDVPARQDQAVTAGFAVLAGAGVIAAALWLQHVCKLPENHDDPAGPAATHR
ncbi:DUF3180 domain-containing protein [Kitasatospora sp. NPDC054939]